MTYTGDELLERVREEARAEECRVICEWLRSLAGRSFSYTRANRIADWIERGEHRSATSPERGSGDPT